MTLLLMQVMYSTDCSGDRDAATGFVVGVILTACTLLIGYQYV